MILSCTQHIFTLTKPYYLQSSQYHPRPLARWLFFRQHATSHVITYAKFGILYEYSRPPPRGLFCAHQRRTTHVITFKSPEDLSKLPPEDPAYPTVKELVDRLITAYTEPGQPYKWQDYGYIILIQEGDVDRELVEIWDGARLINLYWEGIMKRGDFFIGIVLLNNEAAHCYVIPCVFRRS